MITADDKLLAFLESLPLAAVVADIGTGEILWINGTHAALSGATSPAQLLGRSIFEFINPDQLSVAMGDLEAVQRGESPDPVVYHVRRVDGGNADVNVASVPAVLKRRRVMVSVLTDVTATERAKRDLARSEARFRSLVETAPLGIMVVQHDAISYANIAAALVLEVPRSDLIGSTASDLVDVPSRKLLRSAREAILAGTERSVEVEVRFVPRGRVSVQVACTVSSAEWEGEPAYRISMRRRTEFE